MKKRGTPTRVAPGQQPAQPKQWDAKFYEAKHAVVFKAAADLVDLLAPVADERILDLGCGTGQLTAEIANRGARVIGIDQSQPMIDQAQENFPDIWFEVGDATQFKTTHPFDAVFSNAVLHWIIRPTEAIGRVWDALRPGGRFVAEFGGKGNIAQIISGAQDALAAQGRLVLGDDMPWYFPAIGEYAGLLEAQGFEVRFAQLFDRPTKLEGDAGMRNWFTQFGSHFIDDLDDAERDEFFARVEQILRPKSFHDGAWTADYRRLRFAAVKPLAEHAHMAETFFILLAGGVMLAAAISDPKEVTLQWLRLAGIIALTMCGLAGAFYAFAERDIANTSLLLRRVQVGLFVMTGLLVLGQLGFVQVAWRRTQRTFAAAAFVVAVLAGCNVLHEMMVQQGTAVRFPPKMVSMMVQTFACAGVSATAGLALMDMLLGHAYLTASQMTMRPFARLNRALAGVLVVRALGATVGVFALQRWQPLEMLWGVHGLLMITRWLVGLAVPAVFIYMAHDCIQRRSTQAATGILYVAGVLIFIGEIVALHRAIDGIAVLSGRDKRPHLSSVKLAIAEQSLD